MRNCIDYESLIQEYLDGELDEAQKAEFEEHIGKCPSCQKSLEETRSLFSDIRNTAEKVPKELTKNVISHVRTENCIKMLRRKSIVRALGGIAVCCVIAVGIIAAMPIITEDQKINDSAPLGDAFAASSNSSKNEYFSDDNGDITEETVPEIYESVTEEPANMENEQYDGSVPEGDGEATVGAVDTFGDKNGYSSGSGGDSSNDKNESAQISDNDVDTSATDIDQAESTKGLSEEVYIDLGACFMKEGVAGLSELFGEMEKSN